MDHPIGEVLKSEFSTAGSQISICIEVSFDATVNRAKKGVESDVELSLMN
jgi:hypothetical protein